MCRRGWSRRDNSDSEGRYGWLCLSWNDKTAAAACIRVCTLCTQAGWLELVYDDVCGKQADRVVYAGEGAETGSEKAMHNKPGREVLRYSESTHWVD
jgi:hypothetical protein